MPTTPRGLPYPVPQDPADVPADLQALAEATDPLLPTIVIAERGSITQNGRTFAPEAAFQHVISYTRTYTGKPQLVVSIESDNSAIVVGAENGGSVSGGNIYVGNTRTTEQANVNYVVRWHTVSAAGEVT